MASKNIFWFGLEQGYREVHHSPEIGSCVIRRTLDRPGKTNDFVLRVLIYINYLTKATLLTWCSS